MSGFDEPCHVCRLIRGECVTCGDRTGPLHMPMVAFGVFCPKCCPIHNGATAAAPDAIDRMRLLGIIPAERTCKQEEPISSATTA